MSEEKLLPCRCCGSRDILIGHRSFGWRDMGISKWWKIKVDIKYYLSGIAVCKICGHECVTETDFAINKQIEDDLKAKATQMWRARNEKNNPFIS